MGRGHIGSGVFTIGPLGPCPPLNSEKFLHMAKKCNSREVQAAPIIMHVSIPYKCHQMSYFKAKNAPNLISAGAPADPLAGF